MDVHWRGPDAWPRVWILHQDSTSAQDVPSSPPPKMLMRWEYPDLALCYFWLFPELKMAWRGHRISDTVRIPGHALKNIPEEGFRQCFEQ